MDLQGVRIMSDPMLCTLFLCDRLIRDQLTQKWGALGLHCGYVVPEDRDYVGLTNGLAWTEVGGDVLTTEAMITDKPEPAAAGGEDALADHHSMHVFGARLAAHQDHVLAPAHPVLRVVRAEHDLADRGHVAVAGAVAHDTLRIEHEEIVVEIPGEEDAARSRRNTGNKRRG